MIIVIRLFRRLLKAPNNIQSNQTAQNDRHYPSMLLVSVVFGRWSQLRRWLWSGPDPNIGFDSQCAATLVHGWVKNYNPKTGSNTFGLEYPRSSTRSYLKLLMHSILLNDLKESLWSLSSPKIKSFFWILMRHEYDHYDSAIFCIPTRLKRGLGVDRPRCGPWINTSCGSGCWSWTRPPWISLLEMGWRSVYWEASYNLG